MKYRILVLVMVVAGFVEAVHAREVQVVRGPDIVLVEGEDRRVYEFWQNGELRMLKIVPFVGKPYYLVPSDPTRGGGDMQRAETLVSIWRLLEF